MTNKSIEAIKFRWYYSKFLEVEGFGDRFETMQSKEFTQVAFQNCGRQPEFCTSKKATNGALAMSAGKYDTLLFAEH